MNSKGEKEAQFSSLLHLWPLYKTCQSCRRLLGGLGESSVDMAVSRPVDGAEVQEGFLVVCVSSGVSLTTRASFQVIERFQQMPDTGERRRNPMFMHLDFSRADG